MKSDKDLESNSVNESFKAEFTEKWKNVFRKSNNLYGVTFTYEDPDFGRTIRSIQTRGYFSWEDFAKEIFEIIETCEIISYSFPIPEP